LTFSNWSLIIKAGIYKATRAINLVKQKGKNFNKRLSNKSRTVFYLGITSSSKTTINHFNKTLNNSRNPAKRP